MTQSPTFDFEQELADILKQEILVELAAEAGLSVEDYRKREDQAIIAAIIAAHESMTPRSFCTEHDTPPVP